MSEEKPTITYDDFCKLDLRVATVLEARAPDQTFDPARQAVTRQVLGQLGVLKFSQ